MAIDLSKYKDLESVEDYEQKTSSGSLDLSKYDITPATATPVVSEPTLGSKIKSKLGEIRTSIKNTGKGSITFDAQGKPTLKKEVAEQAIEGAMGFVGGSGAIKSLKPKTVNILKKTPEIMSDAEENAANLAGRIKDTVFGKKTLPSTTEKRAAQILEGQISTNATKNPSIIKNELSRRGQEAEKFLEKNRLPITAQEQKEMFDVARKKFSEFATKTEMKAYDEQLNTFTKHLVGTGGYYTDTFYKALKRFEERVTSKLSKGKMALLGDAEGKGSAKILAAQDIRKVVRDIISKKHPEFKGKMFDLASLYDVLSTALTKSNKLTGTPFTRLTKKYPLVTSAAKTGVTVAATLLGAKGLGFGQQQSGYNPNE